MGGGPRACQLGENAHFCSYTCREVVGRWGCGVGLRLQQQQQPHLQAERACLQPCDISNYEQKDPHCAGRNPRMGPPRSGLHGTVSRYNHLAQGAGGRAALLSIHGARAHSPVSLASTLQTLAWRQVTHVQRTLPVVTGFGVVIGCRVHKFATRQGRSSERRLKGRARGQKMAPRVNLRDLGRSEGAWHASEIKTGCARSQK